MQDSGNSAQTTRLHPLRALTSSEILKVSAAVRRLVNRDCADKDKRVRFKHITLLEPPKSLLLPYLDAEAAGEPASNRGFVPRCAQATYSVHDEPGFNESIISLETENEVSTMQLKTGEHLGFDRDEVIKLNQVILTHPDVLAAIKELGLPDDVVIQCDTWPYGSDKDSTPDTMRQSQAMLYARAPHNHPESNMYSFPLPISPVIDLTTLELVKIDALPTGGKEDGAKLHTAPKTPLAHCVENEYHPDLITGNLRQDLKPLIVQQPEGPSYKVEDDNCISWQKWRFRVGFNWREGMTIHDVRYDSRKLFYRLSMSEMTVPYGDPRSPYHRRQAFNLGDAGAGLTANNLRLGCDCLGSITYFDALLTDSAGTPYPMPNAICLHEQVQWSFTIFPQGVREITDLEV